ncbi:serine/threonine-protein kinase [Paludisphaera rhizosphaerae]|uniref:serine/threonine-protein kinase n=1 Tax=Paludisphaera rhizosphaerae TaxID=2711216 RepID=UPI0013EB6684|nr:serine/threonine-protein kinase [Paludisphaera rhizosphaerae]
MLTAPGGDSDKTDGGHPPTDAETTSDGGRPAPPPVRAFGDFRIIREIGRGGMGVVYEAWQISLSRRVALKVLSHGLTDPRRRRRFDLEAKAAGGLHHTNIVPVFGCGEHDGTLYYVMQFIPGVGLDAVLDAPRGHGPRQASTENLVGSSTPWADARGIETRPWGEEPTAPVEDGSSSKAESEVEAPRKASPLRTVPDDFWGEGEGPQRWKWIARLGVQAADGLGYAHSKDIQHRDVKPSNLLLDERGTLWLTDFGLAKWGGDAESAQGGDVVGTLRYMPPEALEGDYGPTGDLYGLGLTLYELLAGRPAFNERDRGRLFRQVSDASPTPLRQLDRRIPPDLAAIVHKAIKKHPSERYASAAAMEADLQRFVEDRPVWARRASAVERYWRWARRNPAIAILGAVLTAVLVLATAASLEAARRFRAQAESQRILAEEREAGRREAQHARDEESEAHQLAVIALDSLNATREELDRTLYDTRANLAAAAWEGSDYGQYRTLLKLLTPEPGAVDHRGWEWRYLIGLRSRERLAVGGPEEPLLSVSVSPDGSGFATLTADGAMRLHATSDGRERLVIRPPMRRRRVIDLAFGIHALAYSPDGARLAGAGPDGSIGIYRVHDGSLERELDGEQAAVLSLAWTPDGSRLAAGFAGHIVRIWDTASGAPLKPIPGRHGGPVTSVAVSPDGSLAATASSDGLVRIWNLGEAPTLVHALQGHEGGVRCVAFSPDGRRLASAGLDGTLRVWQVESGEPRTVIRAHQGGIFSMALPRKGGWIATGGADDVVRVWDLETGRQLQEFLGHTDGVEGLAADVEGRVLISSSPDGFAKVWDPTSPPHPRSLDDPSLATLGGAADCLALSPDGRLITTGHYDGTIRLWEASTGQLLSRLGAHASRVRAVAFSPDGRRLVSCEGDPNAAKELRGVAKVWDLESGEQIGGFAGHNDVIDDVMFLNGGRSVVSAGGEGKIQIWDVENRESTIILEGHRESVRKLALGPDGRTLASGADDGTIRLWDLETHTLLAELPVGEDVLALAYSPDAHWLAAARRNGPILLWDLRTRDFPQRLEGHIGNVNALRFTPDGRLASAGLDRSVRIWDVQGRRTLLTLKGHAGRIDGLAVSSNGDMLVTCGIDHTVKVWEAPEVDR